ncbi:MULTISPECIES: MFS transporter [unclassified Streptomyces]|uniref:MFS transporter n=1 Tax=unclassified Streptomyces TaxID=2593676 RepID=UPI0021AC6A40|nr:MFS transporter [Streptomyces sp. PsTaAH-137]
MRVHRVRRDPRARGRSTMRRDRTGLLAQLRRPPGGRDARLMLLGQFLDRTGTGVWAAASVLYFTFVVGMDGGRLGLLLGAAGVAGIAGSPVAGRLAQRFSVRALLVWCHALRLGAVLALLTLTGFAALLAVVALICAGDRAAKTLEMVFATEVAGERRATYQALFRSVANAAYGAGAGIAAIGLAVGTLGAYRALILVNAASFVAAAALVLRTTPRRRTAAAPARSGSPAPPSPRTPWRDRRYLLFALLDVPMNLDGAILEVGLPLWLVHHTDAPHPLVPAFLVVNTVLVVVLQLRVSARFAGPGGALRALPRYGLLTLLGCVLLALSGAGGAWQASLLLIGCAVLVTLAELMRSVSSWELAVLLAPEDARPAYLGVAGMSQSVEKSVGPPALTSGVMAAGPLGWIALGAGVLGLSLLQRRLCADRLASPPAPAAAPLPAAS